MDEQTQLAMALSISLLESNPQQSAVIDEPANLLPQPKPKKKGRRKKKADEELDEQTRIAMAISASLADEKRKSHKELGREEPEEDGTKQRAKAKGKRKRAPKKNCQEFPVLLTRQEDERQKILQERINAIIASTLEDYDCSMPVLQCSRIDQKYSSSKGSQTMEAKVKSGDNLWSAAGLNSASEQTGDLSGFYVEQLKSTITPQERKPVTTPRKRSYSMTPRKAVSKTPRKTPIKVFDNQAETTINLGSTLAEDTLSTTQALGMTVQCLAALAEEGFGDPDISSLVDSNGTAASGFIPQEIEERAESPESRLTDEQLCLLEDLSSLVNSSTMSDVVIEIDDGSRLHAHSLFIQLRCPALATALLEAPSLNSSKGRVLQRVLQIPDVSYESMESVLSYLYSAHLIITPETAAEISKFANRYNLPDLASACEALLPESPERGKQRKGSQRSELDIVNKDLNQLIDSLWEDDQEEEDDEVEDDVSKSREADGSTSDEDEERECLDDQEMDEIYEMALTQRSRNRSGESRDDEEDVSQAFVGDKHGDRSTDDLISGVRRLQSDDEDVEMKSDDSIGRTTGDEMVGEGFKSSDVHADREIGHGGERGNNFPPSDEESDEEMSRTILTQRCTPRSISNEGKSDGDGEDAVEEDWTIILDDDEMDANTSAPGKKDSTKQKNGQINESFEMYDIDDKGGTIDQTNTSANNSLALKTTKCESYVLSDAKGAPSRWHHPDNSANSSPKFRSRISQRIDANKSQSANDHEKTIQEANAKNKRFRNHFKVHNINKMISDLSADSSGSHYPQSGGVGSTDEGDDDEVLLLQCDSTDAETDPAVTNSGIGHIVPDIVDDVVNLADDEESECDRAPRKTKIDSRKRAIVGPHESTPARSPRDPHGTLTDGSFRDNQVVEDIEEGASDDVKSAADLQKTPKVVLHRSRLPRGWDNNKSVEDNLVCMPHEGVAGASAEDNEMGQGFEQSRIEGEASPMSISEDSCSPNPCPGADPPVGASPISHSPQDNFSDDVLSPSPPPSPKFSRSLTQAARPGRSSQHNLTSQSLASPNSTMLNRKSKQLVVSLTNCLPVSSKTLDNSQLLSPDEVEEILNHSSSATKQRQSHSLGSVEQRYTPSLSNDDDCTPPLLTKISIMDDNVANRNTDIEEDTSVTPSPEQLSPVFPLPLSMSRTGATPRLLHNHNTSANMQGRDGMGRGTPGSTSMIGDMQGSVGGMEERFAFDMEEGCGLDDFHYQTEEHFDDCASTRNASTRDVEPGTEKEEEGHSKKVKRSESNSNEKELHAEIDLTHDDSDDLEEQDVNQSHADDLEEQDVNQSYADYPGDGAGLNLIDQRSAEANDGSDLNQGDEQSIDLTQGEDEEASVRRRFDQIDDKNRCRQDDGDASYQGPPEEDAGMDDLINHHDDLLSHHDNMSDSFLLQQLASPGCSSSTAVALMKTPAMRRLQQIRDEYHSPAPITPRPDYDSMLTPELKKELKRFGVKPIGKKKARLLLTEIFSFLHQVMPEDMSDEETQSTQDTQKEATKKPPGRGKRGKTEGKGGKKGAGATKQSKAKAADGAAKPEGAETLEGRAASSKETAPRKGVGRATSKPVKRKKAVSDIDDTTPTKRSRIGSEDGGRPSGRRMLVGGGPNAVAMEMGPPGMVGDGYGLSCSQESHDSSYDSNVDDFGESIYHEEEFEADSDIMASQQVRDMPAEIVKYIMDNKDLHLQVLNYEVLRLEDLYKELKEKKIVCSKIKLMEFLDSRCITFRQGEAGSRQRKPKKAKPKK